MKEEIKSDVTNFLHQLEMVCFRGFDRFLLQGLHPFTIIGGRNNVGKTSILEALYYLANRSVGVAPGRLMLSRKMSLRRRDLSPLFYCGRQDLGIHINAFFSDGARRSLTLEKTDKSVVDLNLEQQDEFALRGETSPSVYVQRGETTYSNGEKSLALSMLYFTHREYKARDMELKGDREHSRKAWEDRWKCHYYQSRVMANMSELYRTVFRLKREKFLQEALCLCDRRVRDVVFDGEQLLIDIGLGESRLPVEVMGDGMIKIADILALVALSNPGDMLCIDEIENGLHYSVMGKFVRALSEFAGNREVQIVATTHSREFLQQLSSVGEDSSVLSESGYFAYQNLIRWEDGNLESLVYDFEQFSSAVDAGKEIR